MSTPRTDALFEQFGPVMHPAVMAYNSLARELERELSREEAMHTTTMHQRDEAENAADQLASAVLDEPIDWPDHGAKWEEALEVVQPHFASYDKLVEALEVIHAITESDCGEFLPIEIRERIDALMPESMK